MPRALFAAALAALALAAPAAAMFDEKTERLVNLSTATIKNKAAFKVANNSALAYVDALASLKLTPPDTNTTASQFSGTVSCVFDTSVGAVTGLQFGVQSVCAGGVPPGDVSSFTVPQTGYISSVKVGLVPKTTKVGGVRFRVEDAANPKAPPTWYDCGDVTLPSVEVVPPGMSLATLGSGCVRADPADPASGLQLDGTTLYPVVTQPSVTAPAPVSALNTYIYAISDNSVLYEIDVAAQSWRPVLTATTGGAPNGLAYDTIRSDLFWIAQDQSLYYWNMDPTATYTKLALPAQLGLSGSISVSDASYWNSRFWYVNVLSPNILRQTMTLNAAALSYTAAGLASFAGLETFTLAFKLPNGATTSVYNQFGDIAISPDGVLYGQTTDGAFWTANLAGAAPGSTITATVLKPSTAARNAGFQLSFSCDYKTLYGQVYQFAAPPQGTGLPAGQVVTFDTSTGAYTVVPGFITTNGANPPRASRDLGGPACQATGSTVEVAVTKTVLTPPSPANGNKLTYKIVVYNTGTNPAAGMYVSDQIPASITGVSFTATYSTLAAGPTTGTAADLALLQITLGPGASAEFLVTGTVDPAATSVNTVQLLPPAGQVFSGTSKTTATAAYPNAADPASDPKNVKARLAAWDPVKELSVNATLAKVKAKLNASMIG